MASYHKVVIPFAAPPKQTMGDMEKKPRMSKAFGKSGSDRDKAQGRYSDNRNGATRVDDTISSLCMGKGRLNIGV